MAKATVTEEVTEVVTPAGVTLELTLKEAQFMYALVCVTNGNNPAWDIYSALRDSGVGKGEYTYFPSYNLHRATPKRIGHGGC